MNICNETIKLLDKSNNNSINNLIKNDIQELLKNPNHYFYNYINYVIISQMFIKNIKIQHNPINKTHNILNILELLYLYYKQFYKNILIKPSNKLSILESYFTHGELINYNLFINKLTYKIQKLYDNSNDDNYEINSSSNESFVYYNNTIHINYKNIILELLNFFKNKENILDVLIYDFEIEIQDDILNNIKTESTNEQLNKFIINNEHLKKININYYKLLILILEKRFNVLNQSYKYQQNKIKKLNSKNTSKKSKITESKNKKNKQNIIKLSNTNRYNLRRYFEIDTLNKNILKIFFNSINNTQLLTPEFNLLFNPFTSLINLIEIYNQVSHKITLTFTFDNSNYFINDKPLNMVGDIEKDIEYLKSLPELQYLNVFESVFEYMSWFYNENICLSNRNNNKILKFDGKLEFYLSSENNDLMDLFSVGVNQYIMEIISRYCCFNYILGSSRVPDNFIIFLVDFNKSMMHVKDKKDLIFTSSEINTGVTNMRDIIITRFEEFMKTMIHELFHFHDMDFKSTPKFLTDFVIDNLGIKTNILDRNGDETLNIFEAYVEYNASIINIFYHLFFNIYFNDFDKNKSISNILLSNNIFKASYNVHLINYKFLKIRKKKLRFFYRLNLLLYNLRNKNINNEKLLEILSNELTNQINYTIYKLTNILRISNIFYLNNFESLKQLLTNNKNKLNISQSTNVISYFLLKLIFYFNILFISGNKICDLKTSKFKISEKSFRIIKNIINSFIIISQNNKTYKHKTYILINTIKYYLKNFNITDLDKKILDQKKLKNILNTTLSQKINRKINKKIKKNHANYSNTLKMTCIGI